MTARICKLMGLAFFGFILLAWLVLPRVGSGPAHPSLTVLNNLRNVGFAHYDARVNYQGDFLPTKNSPNVEGLKSSWRVEILPCYDNAAAYRLYDHNEPWNSEQNLKIQSAGADLRYGQVTSTADDFQTAFVAVLDDEGNWMHRRLWEEDADEDSNRKNLLSSRIVLIETAHSGIHWMEPRDFPARWISLKVGDSKTYSISSRVGKGGAVCFADGHAKILSPSTSPEVLKRMLGLADGSQKLN